MAMADTQTYILAGFVLNLLGIGFALVKLGIAVGKFETIGKQQALEISQLKDTVKAIGSLVTEMAVSSQRMDMMAERLNRNERVIDDLRRGEGFILPISESAHRVKPSGQP